MDPKLPPGLPSVADLAQEQSRRIEIQVDPGDVTSQEDKELREALEQEEHPLSYDPSPFGKWLKLQTHRKDRIGAIARVAIRDPFWPGGHDRAALAEYFKQMGARDFVLQSLKLCWDEFEKIQRRERTKVKRKDQKQARKKNRKRKRR